ncbi:MAG: 6,7-dimethyl-8-ribityllumazine synthase [Flavisolibacter sp.]
MADIAYSKLFQGIEGIQKLKDALVVIVKTEWNAEITNELELGCKKMLDQYGIRSKTIVVPGAIEIPFILQQFWSSSGQASAFIALGCIIRGGTPHFEYVCQSVTQGITQLNLNLPVPVIFGVLTVDNLEQAKARVGGIQGHKGQEAAVTAMKMMMLNQQLTERKL